MQNSCLKTSAWKMSVMVTVAFKNRLGLLGNVAISELRRELGRVSNLN